MSRTIRPHFPGQRDNGCGGKCGCKWWEKHNPPARDKRKPSLADWYKEG